jgi:uncharacterized protein YkwD
MKGKLTTIVLIAIAAYALSNLFHTFTAKAGSNYSVYLPVVTNGSNGQSSNPTPTPEPTTTPTVDPAQLKADVIVAVNNERAKAGCAPVSAQADLGNGAQAWADYMVANNTYGHSFALDANWYMEHGYTRTDWVSENVAAGPRTGADVVALWMSDEGHKAVILTGCANTSNTFDIGVGFNTYDWVLAIGELHN